MLAYLLCLRKYDTSNQVTVDSDSDFYRKHFKRSVLLPPPCGGKIKLNLVALVCCPLLAACRCHAKK